MVKRGGKKKEKKKKKKISCKPIGRWGLSTEKEDAPTRRCWSARVSGVLGSVKKGKKL